MNKHMIQFGLYTAAFLLFGGCGSSGSTATVPAQTCPEMDDSEPIEIYNHRVESATSTDGLTFNDGHTVLIEHASVPDGILRSDGATWVYFVNGQPGQHGVFIARKEAAEKVFEVFDCLRIGGIFNGNAVDPDIVLDSEGRYRLFYFQGWFDGTGPPPPGAPHPFYMAFSDDGIEFEQPNLILEVGERGTDPTAVQLPNGNWLVALTRLDEVLLASSADGTNFAFTEHRFPGGISELALFDDGTIRLYIARTGLTIFASHDGGETWAEETTTTMRGADPSMVHEADGSWTLYFKTFAPR